MTRTADSPRPSRIEGLRIFNAEAYSSLTTFKRDGTPVATPVWQAVGGDRIYVFTEAASWKVKRLGRNPRIEIAPCNWRGVRSSAARWTGSARVIREESEIATAYAALDRKYGWQKGLVDLLSRLSGRYDGRAMLEITLDD